MGCAVPQIVEILGCNRQTVHNWFNAFEAGGCDALSDRSRRCHDAGRTRTGRGRLIFRTDKKGLPTSFERRLKTARAAAEWFSNGLARFLRDVPGVFDDRTVLGLVNEPQTDGIDNATPTAWLP